MSRVIRREESLAMVKIRVPSIGLSVDIEEKGAA